MTKSELLKLAGIGPKAAKTLEDCGYNTIEKIAKTTADELSELPGIGKATAEKLIQSAKEMVPAAKPAAKPTAKIPTAKIPTAKKPTAKKPTAKKPTAKIPTAKKPTAKIPTAKKPTAKIPTAKKEILKETIPKPITVKAATKPVAKPSEPLPSVKKPAAKPAAKPVAKPPAKPVAKPPAKKPVAITPAARTVTKKPAAYAKPKISNAAKRAIELAPEMRIIKQKRAGKKTKVVKKEKISQTYGIVNSIVHDRTGKSSNRSIVVKLYNTEIPLPKYLGRKVTVSFPNSSKQLTGVVSKIHGKKSSVDKTIIIRFKQGVSPHIITGRAIFA